MNEVHIQLAMEDSEVYMTFVYFKGSVL